MKICRTCGLSKDIDQYRKSKTNKSGHDTRCNDCTSDYNKEYHKKWYAQNRESKLRYDKEWKKNNKERIQANYYKNWEKRKEDRINWKKSNPEKVAMNKQRYKKRRYANDVSYRTLCNLYKRMWLLLKNKTKSDNAQSLLGCNHAHLKEHIESQFKNGMTWENYGVHGWHVDHIIPCALFDLSIASEQQKCFHYTNLQPLWAIDNIKKGAKIIP